MLRAQNTQTPLATAHARRLRRGASTRAASNKSACVRPGIRTRHRAAGGTSGKAHGKGHGGLLSVLSHRPATTPDCACTLGQPTALALTPPAPTPSWNGPTAHTALVIIVSAHDCPNGEKGPERRKRRKRAGCGALAPPLLHLPVGRSAATGATAGKGG